MSERVAATTLVPGRAEGPGFVMREPLSFWGGLEVASGRIVDRSHPQRDEIVTGHVLVMAAGRGSSSGSSVLAEAIRLGTGPAGIILLSRDAIVVTGAMVAAELYGRACPVVLTDAADWPAIIAATHLAIEATDGGATILLTSLSADWPRADG